MALAGEGHRLPACPTVYNFLGIKPGKPSLEMVFIRESAGGLCIGRDSGNAVREDYTTRGTLNDGRIWSVGVTVGKDQRLDLQKLAAAVMAVD